MNIYGYLFRDCDYLLMLKNKSPQILPISDFCLVDTGVLKFLRLYLNIERTLLCCHAYPDLVKYCR